MKIFRLIIVSFAIALSANAQDSLRALFIGNSYTAANSLPEIVQELSFDAGKKLIIDSNAPGGAIINQHINNANTLAKIQQGNWDVVVVQEQSQIPTIPLDRDNLMFPAVVKINDTIRKYNPCAKVVLFMTWGRQFGGVQCNPSMTSCSPNFVDFSHMQDSLESAYVHAAQLIDAIIAPVGIAWKHVIEDTSLILHTADESHPNYEGSYLSACTFFEVLWGLSPVGNNYTGSLNNATANYLQQKAHEAVNEAAAPWNLNLDPCVTVGTKYSFSLEEKFNIYPNPAECQIQFNLNHIDYVKSAEIFDVSGQIVQHSTSHVIDVSVLQKGMYFMRIELTNGGLITKMFMKK